MPSLLALIAASVGPILVHKTLPPNTPVIIKAFLDMFVFIFVFYFIYRLLSHLRPDIDD